MIISSYFTVQYWNVALTELRARVYTWDGGQKSRPAGIVGLPRFRGFPEQLPKQEDIGDISYSNTGKGIQEIGFCLVKEVVKFVSRHAQVNRNTQQFIHVKTYTYIHDRFIQYLDKTNIKFKFKRTRMLHIPILLTQNHPNLAYCWL